MTEKKDPFDAARRKGRQAFRDGKVRRDNPYHDYRTDRGSVTFSRAWRRAWFDGFEQEQFKDEEQ